MLLYPYVQVLLVPRDPFLSPGNAVLYAYVQSLVFRLHGPHLTPHPDNLAATTSQGGGGEEDEADEESLREELAKTTDQLKDTREKVGQG